MLLTKSQTFSLKFIDHITASTINVHCRHIFYVHNVDLQFFLYTYSVSTTCDGYHQHNFYLIKVIQQNFMMNERSNIYDKFMIRTQQTVDYGSVQL